MTHVSGARMVRLSTLQMFLKLLGQAQYQPVRYHVGLPENAGRNRNRNRHRRWKGWMQQQREQGKR